MPLKLIASKARTPDEVIALDFQLRLRPVSFLKPDGSYYYLRPLQNEYRTLSVVSLRSSLSVAEGTGFTHKQLYKLTLGHAKATIHLQVTGKIVPVGSLNRIISVSRPVLRENAVPLNLMTMNFIIHLKYSS